MKLRTEAIIVAAGLLVTAGAIWYAKQKVVAALPYVNPFDSRNLVNQGVTSLYQYSTGSTGTIGTDLYDLTESIGKRIDETNKGMRQELDDSGFQWPL